MQDDVKPDEEPKTEAPAEEASVTTPVEAPKEEAKPEAEEPQKEVTEKAKPVEEPAEEKPEPTLAEEMTALTSSAPSQSVAKDLESLPFPWLRVFLIGLFIPLFTAALAVGVYYLIEKTVGYGALANYKWALWAVLGVAGLPVVWGAAVILRNMHVGRAFFLAAGTLICSFGTIALASTLYATPFHTAWNWHPVVLTWPEWMVIGLPFIGGAVIIFLTLIINSLGRYIPKLLTIVLFLVVVAAPWVGTYFRS